MEWLTPIGLALLALIIVREGQRDRAAENARRDKRQDDEREQRKEDNRQWFMMFAALTGKQAEIETAIHRSSRTLGDKVDESQESANRDLSDFKDLFIMTFDMYMENPRATYARIKRMQKAWAAGDMETAQAVADEKPENKQAEGQTPQ